MYEIKILPKAQDDLKEIRNWYLGEFGENTANKVVEKILNSISVLEMFPDSGSLTPDNYLNDKGYRMVICEKFISIYKHIDKKIYIYHISNSDKDYTRIIKNEE